MPGWPARSRSRTRPHGLGSSSGGACHPTPEHLLPLLVAAGAAGDSAARQTYHDRLMGKAVSGFQFG